MCLCLRAMWRITCCCWCCWVFLLGGPWSCSPCCCSSATAAAWVDDATPGGCAQPGRTRWSVCRHVRAIGCDGESSGLKQRLIWKAMMWWEYNLFYPHSQSQRWPWEDKHHLCWGLSAHPRWMLLSEVHEHVYVLWSTVVTNATISLPVCPCLLCHSEITIHLDESDALSASSCRDGETERFVSTGSTGRRVSFNESALYEQEKMTQDKARRYCSDFHSSPDWTVDGTYIRWLVLSSLGTLWLRETSTTWKRPGSPTFTCLRPLATWRSLPSWSVTPQTAALSTSVRLQLPNCPSPSTR